MCWQDMCYQHKDLQQLDPALVSATSLLSLQQPLGVLLLEESLVHGGGPDEPPSKRSRGRKDIPPDTNKWIHLARYPHLCIIIIMLFMSVLAALVGLGKKKDPKIPDFSLLFTILKLVQSLGPRCGAVVV